MISDEQLMQRVQQGDRAALEMLYDRHAPSVLGVLIKIVRSHAVAEELLQETFWRIWDRSRNFDIRKGKFVTWMFSIARRIAIDTLRRWKSRPQADESEHSQEMLHRMPSGNDVVGTVSQNMASSAVRAALDALSPEQRQIIELSYFNGKTRKQIAAELEMPLGTVHTRARLGLQKLRIVLTEQGWEGHS